MDGEEHEEAVLPSTARDPEGMPRDLASHQLINDFWQEFHLSRSFARPTV
jgi:hypothetical protein